jgi:hypothetical protein
MKIFRLKPIEQSGAMVLGKNAKQVLVWEIYFVTCVNLLEPESVFVVFQALNGFLLILTCEGEVFFATHSIESYLGFHQVSHNTDNFVCFFGVIFRPYKSLGSTASSDMMTYGEGIWKKAVVSPSMHCSVICLMALRSTKHFGQKF